jgi:hypothetical protein
VVCLAPRALEDSVRPRRQVGASVRPLNFTVRRSLRSSKRREEMRQSPSLGSMVALTAAHSVVMRASSFGGVGVRVRRSELRLRSGRAPSTLA